jgi:hypothetical protein
MYRAYWHPALNLIPNGVLYSVMSLANFNPQMNL